MRLVVAFDWNGTLLDDLERAVAALGVVMERRGMEALDVGAFREVFHLPMNSLLTTLGFKPADLEAADDEWNTELQLRPASFAPGALDVLQQLRSAAVSVGVITAASRHTVDCDLEHMGVDFPFDFVVAPSPNKADSLRKVAATADHLIYVGDTEYDMHATREAGAVPIGYGAGYRPADHLIRAGAHVVVDDFADLADAIAIQHAPDRRRRDGRTSDD
ncbi:MAG: HAD family hydrolase [Ilumatobacter sp.]|uniref:HAD family hydrolase n=1 Tax=Ilumatobacter sp. TaxID=1967498 RepID=UPI003918BFF4